MERILFIVIGYCFGIIQSAYIVGRFYKIDMREHGSKNLGTTNALRTLGFKAGAIVFLLDVVKSMVAILINMILVKYVIETGLSREALILYTGFGVMMGHNYPFYLGFKGGKGVACSLGTLIVLSPIFTLFLFISAVIIIFITRYISVASICCSIIAVVTIFALGYRGEDLYITILIVAFIIFKHRANIKRLIKGNENKFTIKKKVV